MYLKEVRIKNFRSLKDVTVLLDENTVLIGENNSGKTAFLDALRIALTRNTGRNLFDEYDYYMDDAILSPKDSEGIEIILRFTERESEEWNGYIMDTFSELFQYVDGDEEKASIILSVKSVYNEMIGEFESRIVFLNNQYVEIVGKVQSQTGAFLKLTPIFYLQALRDIKDTFSSKSPLWGRFLKKANIPKEAMEELQERIEGLNKDIISNDVNLTKLVKALEHIQNVLDFEGENLVAINALPMKSWDLLSKSQIVLNNSANHMGLPLERHGQGTQSVTTILLFKAYITILLEELHSREAQAILTLEEPEAHLHPQAVRAIEHAIREINCQKIITTHSPYFIQNIDLRNIRHFKKKSGITSVSQIIDRVRFRVDSITENLQKMVEYNPDVFELQVDSMELIIKKPLEESMANGIRSCCPNCDVESYIRLSHCIFTEKELHDLNMYVQKTRGEILFSSKWMLYEGQTEDVILTYCADLMGYNLDEYGVSGIMYQSNGTAGAFVKLADALGIQWLALGDNDQQGIKTRKEIRKCGYSEAETLNKVILTNVKDIEHEFANTGFLADYETILQDDITEDMKSLKANGDMEKYKKEIVAMIQKGKVENAYKLVENWKKRGMEVSEIPEFLADFIKRVCLDE